MFQYQVSERLHRSFLLTEKSPYFKKFELLILIVHLMINAANYFFLLQARE